MLLAEDLTFVSTFDTDSSNTVPIEKYNDAIEQEYEANIINDQDQKREKQDYCVLAL